MGLGRAMDLGARARGCGEGGPGLRPVHDPRSSSAGLFGAPLLREALPSGRRLEAQALPRAVAICFCPRSLHPRFALSRELVEVDVNVVQLDSGRPGLGCSGATKPASSAPVSTKAPPPTRG